MLIREFETARQVGITSISAHQNASTDSQRARFIHFFRAAQAKQERGIDRGIDFHTKPKYSLKVDSIKTLNLTYGMVLQPAQAKVIQETVCANWKFKDKSDRIVATPICDAVQKTITAKSWSCYKARRPETQQQKVLRLLSCSPGMCYNHKEIKAIIPGIKDARGTMEELWKKGKVRADTIDKQVVKSNGKALSADQLTKIPPSMWNIEIKKRKISPAALKRKRSLSKTFTPRSTLVCFRGIGGMGR